MGVRDTKLELDVRTRWNSLVKMIKSLLRIRGAVNRALSEFSILHLVLSEAEVELLKCIVECLDTIEVGATELRSNLTRSWNLFLRSLAKIRPHLENQCTMPCLDD